MSRQKSYGSRSEKKHFLGIDPSLSKSSFIFSLTNETTVTINNDNLLRHSNNNSWNEAECKWTLSNLQSGKV
jgi:hypothetical protein